FSHFNVEKYANAMQDFIRKVKPSVILYGGTSIGRSFAPRIASRFKTGLTADCTILGMKENTDLIQNRPAFGGNIMAGIICPNNRPQMATVRYKIFKMPIKETPHGETIFMDVSKINLSSNMKLLEVKPKDSNIDISEAEIIVAIGRPFKNAEDIALAKKLASLLGAELASTRPLVETGLMDPRKQIGLSGRTVAPKLLITLGVSGAVQFAAGMKGSQIIFSICDDKNAAIFDIAHYGIVGDVFKILPKLIAEVKILKGLA
ncbi:MAG: electron transfer flavoprotein subunit alpha/FixB family protein, partial [Bacilli bacterium]